MIARVWRGSTEPEHADAYERLLREVVYPGLRRLAGYRGGSILRHDGMRETEFVTVNLFASLNRQGMQAVTVDLKGKRAFVTGGSRGIGAAIERELASRGAAVTFTRPRSAVSIVVARAESTKGRFPDTAGKSSLSHACGYGDAPT